ncbi:MAG: aminotransferase class V-fold PLP-dependent enzyme, partial [Cellulomonadaceae bacterium]|nr:aminotransferase class V-fold PLP-dependent enzyme [Cellulomonadaceae bacterium]
MDASTRAFFDAGGRAPLHPAAQAAFDDAVSHGWADPRRLHREGRQARHLLDEARQSFAAALGARTEEIHLTHGHTSGLHTVIAATGGARRRVGSGVVASAVERAAVLAAARHLDPGARPVQVDRYGRVDLDAWRAAVAVPGVALAALQHANGEVGTLQPLDDAHHAAQAAGVPLVVDAGASLGHVDVGQAWDVLAADPGDWGGPSGIGVLAVRSRVRTRPTGPDDEDPWAPGGVSVPA